MSGEYNPQLIKSRDKDVMVEELLEKLKSQGCFDAKRKQFLSEITNKSTYHNLTNKVETLATKFLEGMRWPPAVEKHQLREQLRLHIQSTDVFNNSINRLVEQEVTSKIQSELKPLIESKGCDYLEVNYEKWKQNIHRIAMDAFNYGLKKNEFVTDTQSSAQITSVSSSTVSTTTISTTIPIISPSVNILPPPMAHMMPPPPTVNSIATTNTVTTSAPPVIGTIPPQLYHTTPLGGLTTLLPPPPPIMFIPPPLVAVDPFPPPPPPEDEKSLPPPPPPENGPNTPTDDYVPEFCDVNQSPKPMQLSRSRNSTGMLTTPLKCGDKLNDRHFRSPKKMNWHGLSMYAEDISDDSGSDSEKNERETRYRQSSSSVNTLKDNVSKSLFENFNRNSKSNEIHYAVAKPPSHPPPPPIPPPPPPPLPPATNTDSNSSNKPYIDTKATHSNKTTKISDYSIKMENNDSSSSSSNSEDEDNNSSDDDDDEERNMQTNSMPPAKKRNKYSSSEAETTLDIINSLKVPTCKTNTNISQLQTNFSSLLSGGNVTSSATMDLSCGHAELSPYSSNNEEFDDKIEDLTEKKSDEMVFCGYQINTDDNNPPTSGNWQNCPESMESVDSMLEQTCLTSSLGIGKSEISATIPGNTETISSTTASTNQSRPIVDTINQRKQQIRARILEIDAKRSQLQKEELFKKINKRKRKGIKHPQHPHHHRHHSNSRHHHHSSKAKKSTSSTSASSSYSSSSECEDNLYATTPKFKTSRQPSQSSATGRHKTNRSISSSSSSSNSSSVNSRGRERTNENDESRRQETNSLWPTELGSQSPPSPQDSMSDDDDDFFTTHPIKQKVITIAPIVKIQVESEPEEGEVSSDNEVHLNDAAAGAISHITATDIGIDDNDVISVAPCDIIPNNGSVISETVIDDADNMILSSGTTITVNIDDDVGGGGGGGGGDSIKCSTGIDISHDKVVVDNAGESDRNVVDMATSECGGESSMMYLSTDGDGSGGDIDDGKKNCTIIADSTVEQDIMNM